MAVDNPDELRQWRWELVARLDEHPMDTWSCSLTRAVVGVIDVAFELVEPPAGRPRLSVVRDTVQA